VSRAIGLPFGIVPLQFEESVIAKNNRRNTFAKRQREQDKKYKAESKRARRLKKEEADPAPPQSPEPDTGE
jgi:hypothetical protein